MQSLGALVFTIIDIYTWVIIIAAIMSWLVVFNVVNPRNGAVRAIGNLLHRLTEPVLKPIRRFMPDLGGGDISPVILLLALFFARSLLAEYVWPNLVR